ncbi:MAG: protein-L-isoaspartate(D-aspartate) O-methyltransferase [Betaproteobacteria bacterium]|jgi:protein-L-isoaspartate(D-aspartate) O-methyltransferase|nr:protein-L-isoaspartate(D-aspartate) O-methyltransferase [Betaproteobacteria bacterium]NBT09611.1 protein-L-isoaspartate(D-aspartate) O-methyltransferase [Betaproteobacteria bacterium]
MSRSGQPPARRSRFPASVGATPTAKPGPAGQVLRPQRPVHEAAQDAARRVLPSGVGLDSEAVRRRMVQRLEQAGIRCEPVLQAMAQVPRHQFVDSALAAQAYEDTSLPIGLGQTISKPSVVARMLSLLHAGARARELGHLGKALEIGTGCGYQAAVLCLLARQVVSIERLAPLHEQARQRLDPWRAQRLLLIWADGRLGHGPSAPYDSIVAAAGGDEVPGAWLEQLAVGGRLVAPVQSDPHGGHMLLVVDRHEGGFTRAYHEPVHFVPLKSGAQ